MNEIWQLQPKFVHRSGKKPLRLMTHLRFRAAYDFLLLRAKAGETDQKLADWWTHFQDANEEQQKELQKKLESTTSKKRRRRKPRNQNEKPQVDT
jgi:poly(A) polymerase